MKRKNIKNPNFLRKILFGVVICLAVVIIAKIIQEKAITSDFFKIQYISVKAERYGDAIEDFANAQIINKNIFQLNLHELSIDIVKKFPNVSKVLLIRHFPNKIEINAILRRPLAKVKLPSGSFYYLDSDATLFLEDRPPEEIANLVVVIGLHNDSSKSELRKIVDLLEQISSVDFGAGFIVVKIQADERGECTFFFSNGIYVKIGARDFKNRLERLKLIWDEDAFRKKKVKYIDIRFKEPSLVYAD